MMIFHLRVFLSLENCVFIEVMNFHPRDQISFNWGGKIKLITFVYRPQITKVINLRSWWWIFWSQWHIFIFYHNDIFHFTNFYRIFSKVRTFHKSHGISSKCWLQPHQKLAYHWQPYKSFTKHKFLLLHNKVWFKWTLQNLSIFGNFAEPKCLGISKRLNDRSPKLLRDICFYFYTIEFDSNELYKICQFFAILPSPNA